MGPAGDNACPCVPWAVVAWWQLEQTLLLSSFSFLAVCWNSSAQQKGQPEEMA